MLLMWQPGNAIGRLPDSNSEWRIPESYKIIGFGFCLDGPGMQYQEEVTYPRIPAGVRVLHIRRIGSAAC